MIDEVEAALGPIDVLVNSAGAAKRYAPGDLTAQAWHDAMDAKFFSYIHPLDIVVRRMAARGRGSVINIIGAGGKTANPVHIPGGAANAALMLATAGLAAAHGPKGVRINAINPGGTLTGPRAAGTRCRGEDDRARRGRDPEAAAGADSVAASWHAGGDRAGRAVPRVGAGELRDGRDHSDGWRRGRRHLTEARIRYRGADSGPRPSHADSAPNAAAPARISSA